MVICNDTNCPKCGSSLKYYNTVQRIVKKEGGVTQRIKIRRLICSKCGSIKSYILFDVLIPSIKDAISEIVRNGIDIILYGDAGYSKSTSNASKVKYKSYDKMFDRKRERKYSSSVRAGYSYDDIILDNRGEAEHVLMRMDELISMYDSASVADLYDLVGMTGNYTDNKYGWTDLHNADIIRIRDGYLLKLPRALPLD